MMNRNNTNGCDMYHQPPRTATRSKTIDMATYNPPTNTINTTTGSRQQQQQQHPMMPGVVEWLCHRCSYTCISASCPGCGATQQSQQQSLAAAAQVTSSNASACDSNNSNSVSMLSLKNRLKGSFLGRGKRKPSTKPSNKSRWSSGAGAVVKETIIPEPLLSDSSSQLLIREEMTYYRQTDRTNVVMVEEGSGTSLTLDESQKRELQRNYELALSANECHEAQMMMTPLTATMTPLTMNEEEEESEEFSSSSNDNDTDERPHHHHHHHCATYISSDDESEPPLIVNRGGKDDGERPVAPRRRRLSPMAPARRNLASAASPRNKNARSPVPLSSPRAAAPPPPNRSVPARSSTPTSSLLGSPAAAAAAKKHPRKNTRSPVPSSPSRPMGAPARKNTRSPVPPSRSSERNMRKNNTARSPVPTTSTRSSSSPMASSSRKNVVRSPAVPSSSSRSSASLMTTTGSSRKNVKSPASSSRSATMPMTSSSSSRKNIRSAIPPPPMGSRKSERSPVRHPRKMMMLGSSASQKSTLELLSSPKHPSKRTFEAVPRESSEESIRKALVKAVAPSRRALVESSGGSSRKTLEEAVVTPRESSEVSIRKALVETASRRALESSGGSTRKTLEQAPHSRSRALESSQEDSIRKALVETVAPSSRRALESSGGSTRRTLEEALAPSMRALESSGSSTRCTLESPSSSAQSRKTLEKEKSSSSTRKTTESPRQPLRKLMEKSSSSRKTFESPRQPPRRGLGSRNESSSMEEDDPIRSLMPIRTSFNSSHDSLNESGGTEWSNHWQPSDVSLDHWQPSEEVSVEDTMWSTRSDMSIKSRVPPRQAASKKAIAKTSDTTNFETTAVPPSSLPSVSKGPRVVPREEEEEETPESYYSPAFTPESSATYTMSGNSNNFNHQANESLVPSQNFMSWSEREKKSSWTCSACTFENENALHLMCAVCGTQRERGSSEHLDEESFSNDDAGALERTAQETVVKTRSQAIEEEWFEALQQERVDELVQLQRELLEEYQSKPGGSSTTTTQTPATSSTQGENMRRLSSRLTSLVELHQQESARSLHQAQQNEASSPSYENRLAELRERGHRIQEMQRQQDSFMGHWGE